MGLTFPMIMAQRKYLGAFGRPHDMDGTGEAGIEGMDDPENFDGLVNIGHGRSDQCLFNGAPMAG